MKKRAKKIVVILLLILVGSALAAGLFLVFWPSLGKNPSKKQQTEYEVRTDAFYDGIFHTPEKFQLIVDTGERTKNEKIELTPEGEIPVNKIMELPEAGIEDLTITWFGHSNLAEDSDVSVSTPQIGETVNFLDISNYQEKWWQDKSVDSGNKI